MSSIINATAHPNTAAAIDYMLAGKTTSLDLQAIAGELGRILDPKHLTEEVQHLLALPSHLHHGHARFSIKAGRRHRHVDILHFHDGTQPNVLFNLHKHHPLPSLEHLKLSQHLRATIGDYMRRGRGFLALSGDRGSPAAMATEISHLGQPSLIISKKHYKTLDNIDCHQPKDDHDLDRLLALAKSYSHVFIEDVALTQKQIAGLIDSSVNRFIALHPNVGNSIETLRQIARAAESTTAHNIIGVLHADRGSSHLRTWTSSYQEALVADFEPSYRDGLTAEMV